MLSAGVASRLDRFGWSQRTRGVLAGVTVGIVRLRRHCGRRERRKRGHQEAEKGAPPEDTSGVDARHRPGSVISFAADCTTSGEVAGRWAMARKAGGVA